MYIFKCFHQPFCYFLHLRDIVIEVQVLNWTCSIWRYLFQISFYFYQIFIHDYQFYPSYSSLSLSNNLFANLIFNIFQVQLERRNKIKPKNIKLQSKYKLKNSNKSIFEYGFISSTWRVCSPKIYYTLPYFIYQLIQQSKSLAELSYQDRMRNQDQVQCFCQQTVKQSQLKSHIKYCQNYQGLALGKIRLITKDTNVMVLKVFTAEMELCLQIIKDWIKKHEQSNQKESKDRLDNKQYQDWINQISAYERLLTGNQNRKKPQMNLSYPNIPNNAHIGNDYSGSIKQMVSCRLCNKKHDVNIDKSKVFTISKCYHNFCKTCLKKYIDDQYVNKSGNLCCPSKQCKSLILEPQLKQLMGDERLEQLNNYVIRKIMNIAQCVKCQFQFQFVAGTPEQSPIFDKNQVLLNEQAKKHYAYNRFICPNSSCKVEQCKQCKNSPYHLGKSCKQFRDYRQSLSQAVIKHRNCRYCLQPITLVNFSNSIHEALNDICKSSRCQQLAKQACTKILACGHSCPGVKGQQTCLSCLKDECCKNKIELKGQSGSSNCKICQNQSLSAAPCIKSSCGHIFHQKCMVKRIESKWKSQKISFNFCLCPLCKKWLSVPNQNKLASQIKNNLDLFNKIQYLSVERLKFEGHMKDKALIDPNSSFYKNQYSYAMTLYAFFQCYKCKKPYYGGMKSNEGQSQSSTLIKHDQLICPSCCALPIESCEKHGKNFIDYKCKFCCSVGLWYNNRTHYCQSCYKVKQYISKLPKQKLPSCYGQVKCQIGGGHGGNGQQKILKCSACRFNHLK